MNQLNNIILPTKEKRENLFASPFDNVNGIENDPILKTALIQWLFNKKFSISEPIAIDNNTDYYSLPDVCKLIIFDYAQELINHSKIRKIKKIYGTDILTNKIHPTHISNGTTLKFIASNLEKFYIPENIKFLSNDCINSDSNLKELIMNSKLSGNFQRNFSLSMDSFQGYEYTTPIRMLENMPNLETISFANRPYKIEKIYQNHNGNPHYLIRIKNLLGTDFTFFQKSKCSSGFIQVDKSGNNNSFKYDKFSENLNTEQYKELDKIRYSSLNDKDLIVYTNQIYISNYQHIYNILKDFSDPESKLFKSLNIDEWYDIGHIFRGIALQSGNFEYDLCKTYGTTKYGGTKYINRILSPMRIYEKILTYLLFESENDLSLGKIKFYDYFDDLNCLCNDFNKSKNNKLNTNNLKLFLQNCK